MVYLISWRGRGLIGLAAVISPLVGLALGTLAGDNFVTLGLSLGLVVAGISVAVLGRRWNRTNDVHRLGPFRLQTWGYVYLALGLLLLPAAVNMARQPSSVHRPASPTTHQPL